MEAAQKMTNHKINKALGLLKEVTQEESANIQGKVRDQFNATKESISKTAHEVNEKAREMATVADKEVKRNPWRYLGAAAASAGLLGFLFGRRRK